MKDTVANRKSTEHNDRSQDQCLDPNFLNSWKSLSEEEKLYLLPHILANTRAWHGLNRRESTKITGAWLATIFEKAGLSYWD